MNCNFLKTLKAAFLSAAFLFCFLTTDARAVGAPIEDLKKKATELLLQKKKSQAVQLLINYLKTSGNHNNNHEASEFLVKVAQKFIFREAQEAYENSINLTLENLKEATRSNEKCLLLEPQQLECLIQKTRLLLRNKNKSGAEEAVLKIKELVPFSKYESWMALILLKNDIDFKNKQIIKGTLEKYPEENMGLALLELDRCFMARNYSRAKDLIGYFEKNYSDWPDLLFYKYKINLESTEVKQKSSTEMNIEQLVIYANKCKSLNKTAARKFRYDFDLCARSI